MRNIALLEWGPASLFHIQPREMIKVRTGLLEGGPLMPPFLSSMEEGAMDDSDLQVRYALSAYEDLNHAIRNLRHCFGFPYQEYIGYLNTLTRKHRVRREHEGLVGLLRRWAIHGNVDAVFWIDYAKANQPPGSFKMGPVSSRPFGAAHMEICSQIAARGDVPHENDGDESDAGWSDADDEHPAAHSVSPRRESTWSPRASPGDALAPYEPMSVTIGRSVTMRRRGRASKMEEEEAASAKALAALRDKAAGKPRGPAAARTPRDERTQLRAMLQEEVIPGPGSIYLRSMNPGPGYYNPPDFLQIAAAEACGRGGFGHKLQHEFDRAATMLQDMPDPGAYAPDNFVTDLKAKHRPLGCFNKAVKLVPPREATRRLPFISAAASKLESFGVHGGSGVLGVSPTDPLPGEPRAPQFSFGRTRRPW